MKITPEMDLDQLAELMGDTTDREDARIMCEFLLVGDYAHTEHVPEGVWLDCLDMVNEARNKC